MLEFLENLRDVLAMFGLIPGVHQNVFDVDQYESMEVLPEYLIHVSLEYVKGIDQPIWHDEIFIMASRCH